MHQLTNRWPQTLMLLLSVAPETFSHAAFDQQQRYLPFFSFSFCKIPSSTKPSLPDTASEGSSFPGDEEEVCSSPYTLYTLDLILHTTLHTSSCTWCVAVASSGRLRYLYFTWVFLFYERAAWIILKWCSHGDMFFFTLFQSTDVVWDNTEQSAWRYWKQSQVCPFPTGRGTSVISWTMCQLS